MKKISFSFIFILISVLCSCQNNRTKKIGFEKVIGLNAVPSSSEFLIYDLSDMKESVCSIDENSKIEIREIRKCSDTFVLKVLCTDENKRKSAGWCYISDVNLLPSDYEKLAADFLAGLSYTGLFFNQQHSIKLEDCHLLIKKIIETAHEKKIDEQKIINALDLIMSPNEYTDYDEFKTNSPLYFAAKYNYKKLLKYLNGYIETDLDTVYYPEEETLLACAVKNDSYEVFEYLMSVHGFISEWDSGNGLTYGQLAKLSENPKYSELLDVPTVYFNFTDAVKKFQNIKEEPKDKKYDWNVCRYFNSSDDIIKNYYFENAFIKADSNTKINIRTLPDVESEKEGAVYNNSIVTVLDMTPEKTVIDGVSSEWVKIRSSENIEGWVFGDFVFVQVPVKPFYDATEENNYIFDMQYENAYTRCPSKIIYQDLSEEVLNPNEHIYIIDYFDYSDKEMVKIENGCIFPYCIVRTEKGRTGVINSMDIANAVYEDFNGSVLHNPIVNCKVNCTVAEELGNNSSKKICGMAFVNSKGQSEELFLPGTNVYNNISEIVVKSHINPDSKEEYPVIEIYERISDSDKQNVCLYTGKEGRLYIFADFIQDLNSANPYTDDDFTGCFYDRAKNTVYNCFRNIDSDLIKCESWTYAPLQNEPQIYVLESYNPESEFVFRSEN